MRTLEQSNAPPGPQIVIRQEPPNLRVLETADEIREADRLYVAAFDPATVTALLDAAEALEEIAGPSVATTASHSYDAAYRRCRSIAERALAGLRRLDAAGG